MQRKTFLFLLLFVVCWGTSFSQSSNYDCKSYIYDYIKKMAVVSLPKKGEVYFMSMKVINFYNPETKLSPITINIKMEKSAEYYFYESEYMSFYMDKANSYVVLYTPKKIVKGNSDFGNEQEKLKQTILLQDTLIRTSMVFKCEEQELNGEKYKIIYMKPLKFVTDNYHINQMCYKYNLTKEMLSEVTIFYDKSNKISQQTTIYNEIDFNYKKSSETKAYYKIFTRKGSLKKQFYGFEFIDNSKKN